MDELKNLVIQSLETNGVLGQVRAQLRHCVFKAIDNQDQVEQRKSSFHWENPLARKLREDSKASLAAEVIQEFMEFYRLNYSLAIFGPETNLKGKTENRDALASKVGVSSSKEKPILVALIEALLSGGEKIQQTTGEKAPSPVKDTSLRTSIPAPRPAEPASVSTTKQHLDKASNLLEDFTREEKKGLNWNQPSTAQAKPKEEQKPSWMKEAVPQQKSDSGKGSSYGIGDNYEDDFDDDIEEDLPAEEVQLNEEQLGIGASGQGITVSASLGVDPSVDSLALEDYDHVEPVDRLM